MARTGLLDLAERIADGAPIDSDGLATGWDLPPGITEQVRLLERLAQLHASLPDTASFSASLFPSLPGWLDGTIASGPLQTWGPLTILSKIGRGTFGDVYRARDPRLNRPVALKLLRHRDRRESAVIDEGHLMARVRHPNVVTVYGAERIEGRVGLWMELVEGRTLEEELRARGPLDAAELTRIGIDLARALHAVHRAGLLHRDLKAQNVMRDADGRVLLMDFGAGREYVEGGEGDGSLAGTPLYLAPEVLRGEAASPASDIYSLGVLLYHLATGLFPVDGRSLSELQEAHARDARTSLDSARRNLPEALREVIGRALAPAAGSRFDSADAIAVALERAGRRSVTRRGLAAAAAIVLAVAASLAVAMRAILTSPAAPAGLSVVHLTPELQAKFAFRGPSIDGRIIPCSPRGGRWGPAVALCDLSDGSARVLRQPIAPADGPPPVPRESAAPATALASPDGRHLAFVWHVGQGQGSTTSLRVMDRSGANERILQTLTAGSIAIRKWMPDGRRLFVEDRPAGGPARDVLVSIDTAPVVLRERLPEDLTADLSPDGRTIIVARRVGAQADLVAIDAATGAERWRVSDPAEDVFPKFTPDGRSVAFVSDRLGGHSVFVVPVTSLGPAGPPDLLREFGRSRVELIGFGAGGSLFMTVQPGARTAFVADLGLDDLAVGTPHPLDPRAIDDTMAADWNLDGTRIAYIRGRAIRSDSRPEVVIRDVNGGTTWEFPLRGTLMNHGNHVEWSPDSRSLAVLHLEPPTTRTSGSAPAPATPVLYVIDIATRTPRRIRSGPMFDPQWEPSGHALYVGTPDAILRVDLRSAAESPVYEPGPAGRLRGLDLASHAAAFAVLMTPTVKPGAQIQACRLLIVRDGRAGPPLPLTGADCTSVAWADRSRVLVSIIARAGPQLLLVDTSTGQTTRLPLAAAGLRELRVRRDARQLLFTAGDPRPDVWEMTGLPPGR